MANTLDRAAADKRSDHDTGFPGQSLFDVKCSKQNADRKTDPSAEQKAGNTADAKKHMAESRDTV